jgi:hypothetical protein
MMITIKKKRKRTGRKQKCNDWQKVTEGAKDREKKREAWKYNQKCRMFKCKRKGGEQKKESLARNSEELFPYL